MNIIKVVAPLLMVASTATADVCDIVGVQARLIMEDRQAGRSKDWILHDRGAVPGQDSGNVFAESTRNFVDIAFDFPLAQTIREKREMADLFEMLAAGACRS